MVPEPLTRRLLEHRDRYAPAYPPNGNSDHGPMACLAMFGLGLCMQDISRFADNYRGKLAPHVACAAAVDADNWLAHRGQAASYQMLLAFFDRQIASRGWQDTVAHYLPQLVSGWVKEAFHPLIRLGYGIEFGVHSEIAAGLAYLTVAGDDPALAHLAQLPPLPDGGGGYLAFWQSQRRSAFESGRFGARYAQIVRHAPLRAAGRAAQEPWHALSDACLQVFHATHDFFALHMVTGSHALRVCAPYAGKEVQAIGSVGLAVAYLAIGAPALAPLTAVWEQRLEPTLLRMATDEHDIKIAHTALAQSRAFGDPRYESVVAAYLVPRLPGARPGPA